MGSTQKIVQTYLQKHEVGQLFEDMMAKIIKEMPNDPVLYLIKLLQKLHEKKSVSPEKKLKSSSLYKDMGLTGSSIPKKFSKDPQVVLPGSKPLVSTWATSNDLDSVTVSSEDSKTHSKQREYNKPWLTDAGPPKGGYKDKKGIKHEQKDWNSETKITAKTFDELFEQKEIKKNPLSKSLPFPLNDQSQHRKLTDSKWSHESENKENKLPYQPQQIKKMATNDDDDELQIERDKKPNCKKITISPSNYSKFKKQNSRKKSLEQKQKLQALLSNDKTKNTDLSQGNESSDDDAIEMIENNDDLATEGANSKHSVGIKHPIHKSQSSELTANVKIGFCSRCAKMIDNDFSNKSRVMESDTDQLFKPTSKSQSSNILQSDDDDFDSVSQIDSNKPYKPSWPTISDSEGEVDEIKSSPRKIIFKKEISDTEKSAFFQTNSPLRKKTKQFSGNFTSDNESEVLTQQVKRSPRHKPKPKQAWKQQRADTASDGEDTIADTQIKGQGWKQKQAFADDASDVFQ